ncbi:hypothetical protein [Pseudoalteromonas piscicida]|uniref:hypothetical protein n=1 Tax=Pseudoalteromonas piscicida TaxID=43662 RepID=UPI000E358CBF|nr:hypothetical protein [Pseudoalteromonas piscicida]AXR00415.1 hypothetical protein D0N37_23170 [Pseudoalteromonas piscicida]
MENYWFGSTSFVLFCNGDEIYRVRNEQDALGESNEFNITTPSGRLKILFYPNVFSVDIKVIDENDNFIPLKRVKTPIKEIFSRLDFSFDLPSKSWWSRSLFLIEVMTLLLAVWLILEEDYIEGMVILTLTIFGLFKINVK